MIATIAGKELLLALRTVRFVVIVLVCCMLMPVSVWVLSSDYLQEEEDYQGRVGLEERRESGKDMLISIYRPVPQLMALFRGVSVDAVNGIELRFFFGWNRQITSATQSPTHAIFPTVDLTFIIGVVLSTLAIILSFDSLSGEKAAATLRLSMANPLARSSLVIGKWLGLTGALLIPFVLGIIISLLIYLSTTGIVLTPDNWAALAVGMLAAMIFISLFVMLGIMISALTASPTQSIFIGLGIWGLLTILLPQIAIAAAESLVPFPAPQELEKNLRIANNDHANSIRATNRKMVERALDEGWEYQQVSLKRWESNIPKSHSHLRVVNSLAMEYWLQVKEQEGMIRFLSIFSPLGNLNQVLIAVADTGPESQREFLEQAYRYGEHYYKELWNDPANLDFSEKIRTVEKFQYQPLSITERLLAAALPLGSLVLMNLLALIGGVLFFNRYDVR